MAIENRLEISQEELQRNHAIVKNFVDNLGVHPGIVIVLCAAMMGWDIALNHTDDLDPHLHGMMIGERTYIEQSLNLMGIIDRSETVH